MNQKPEMERNDSWKWQFRSEPNIKSKEIGISTELFAMNSCKNRFKFLKDLEKKKSQNKDVSLKNDSLNFEDSNIQPSINSNGKLPTLSNYSFVFDEPLFPDLSRKNIHNMIKEVLTKPYENQQLITEEKENITEVNQQLEESEKEEEEEKKDEGEVVTVKTKEELWESDTFKENV